MVHLIYQEEANKPSADFKAIFFTDVPVEGVFLNGQAVEAGVEYNPDLGADLKDYYPYEILKEELGCNEETDLENKSKKNREGEVFDNRPYDPNICHLLRNPEVPDLGLFCAVKPHIDILDLQVGSRVSEMKKNKKKTLLWLRKKEGRLEKGNFEADRG